TEAAGGQALPRFIAQPVNEMWLSANLAFVMFHALNQGGSDILRHFGSATQQQRYLEPLASGQWTIAMALTEPGAGSDLAATTTKATPLADGNYRIKGQKIFITYGEHDMAANIIHLVLARTPDAPAVSRG
ncbi:acyl-CoA dehydrogenase family protein, partial [Gilvimarinus sp. 1_MG-2023]|uniref:acyl-CoA dehydrogenase family protein n=1 Tax=Gilvimarinus sp. 1_MG-2023 TaxID=3062638 RepID=UPI0026E4158F